MRLRSMVVLVIALGVPAIGAAGQAPHDITMRAAAGAARGYGGNYRDRNLSAFTTSLDFAVRHERSGPVWGLGFTAFRGSGEGVAVVPVIRCIDTLADCKSPCNCGPSSFPDINFGFVDLGWRAMAESYSADFFLQPGMVLLSRPDVLIVGSSASMSLSRRVARVLAVEVGASATYLPSLHPDRVGLRQFTLGLRSW